MLWCHMKNLKFPTCSIKHHAVKTYSEMEYNSTHSYPWHHMVVVSFILSPGKASSVRIGLRGLQRRSGVNGEERKTTAAGNGTRVVQPVAQSQC